MAKAGKSFKAAPVERQVRLLNGYFPANAGPKIAAGTVISLPAAEAQRLVELGKAEAVQ